MALRTVRIIGVGKELPGDPITNEEILKLCNLPKNVTVEWMEERIGIKQRHAVRKLPVSEFPDGKPKEGQYNSDLSVKAIQKALECAGIGKGAVDMIILSTCTPDYPVPSTSSIVQDKLGIPECGVMDIRSACCGSVQGILAAYQFLSTGFYKTIVVVGTEVGSVFGKLDIPEDGSKADAVNAVMIGDGSGAIVMRGFDTSKGEEPWGIEIEYIRHNSIGMGQQPGMWLPAGGSVYPCTSTTLKDEMNYFKHDFRAVLSHGPELYFRGLQDCLAANKLSTEDITLFIPHQANGKVPALASRFGVNPDRVFFNFDKVGNTANASLPIALADLAEQDTLPEGALVMMLAAESTKWLYGSVLLRWRSLKKKQNNNASAIVPRQSNFFKRFYAACLIWTIGKLLTVKRIAGY